MNCQCLDFYGFLLSFFAGGIERGCPQNEMYIKQTKNGKELRVRQQSATNENSHSARSTFNGIETKQESKKTKTLQS